MLPKGQYFPDQRREEQIVRFVRRHWLSFLPWIIILSLMIMAPIIVFNILRNDIYQLLTRDDKIFVIICFGSYFLVTIAVFLTAWISYYLNVAIITPEHLVDIRQNGLFNRRVSEQSLLRVQDVSAHMHGFFQTFFRYGDVHVETAGESPNFDILNIPYPNEVANKILKLHEDLVKSSGFEEEDLAEGTGIEPHKINQKNVEDKIKSGFDRIESLSAKDAQKTSSSADIGAKKEKNNEEINKRIENLYRGYVFNDKKTVESNKLKPDVIAPKIISDRSRDNKIPENPQIVKYSVESGIKEENQVLSDKIVKNVSDSSYEKNIPVNTPPSKKAAEFVVNKENQISIENAPNSICISATSHVELEGELKDGDTIQL